MNPSIEANPDLELKANRGAFRGRANVILFAAAAALYVGARLWRLTASCLWFDEIFSVHAARHSWSQIAPFIAADIIHPPLFYLLLKVWIAIGGESLLWLRLFPALISIASIIPLYFLCRELKLTPGERNLAVLLLAVSGFLIKYAQEVRMYSLLFFLTLCSLWLFIRFIKAGATLKRNLIFLAAANLLLVYTHYSGWAIVILQAVALLLWIRKRLPPFLAMGAALVLAYLPWIYELHRAADPVRGLGQNIGWVGRPGMKDIASSLVTLNRPFSFSQSSTDSLSDPISIVLAVLLFIVPLLVLGWQSLAKQGNKEGREVKRLHGLFLFAFAPAVTFFVASWILPYSVWGTRHLIIAAGPYAILVAIAVMRLRPYWIKATISMLMGCWFLLAATLLLLLPQRFFIWCAWDHMAREVVASESAAGEVVRVYAYEDLVAYHLWFGLDAGRNTRFNVSVVKDTPGIPEDPAYFLPRKFNDISVQRDFKPEGDHFWIAFRAGQWNEAHPPLSLVRGLGYRTGTVLKTKAQGQEAYLVRIHQSR